jgi:hypothetical protein
MSVLPIPPADPLPLPLPPLILKLLLLLTFILHIVAVNWGVGGAVLSFFHALRGRPEDRALARHAAVLVPPGVTFAITLGVAPLLFVQLSYGQFFYSATVLSAFPWLGLFVFLMAGYGSLYRFTGSVTAGRIRAWYGALASALLLAVALVLANMTTLSTRPDLWRNLAQISPYGTRLNLADASLWPRFFHFAAGITASAGMLMAGWGALKHKPSAQESGLRWFIGATLTQALWGSWLLLRQPAPAYAQLHSFSTFGGVALWAGIGCAALAVLLSIPASRRGASPRAVWPPFFLAQGAVIGMVLARDQARDALLEAAGFDPYALPYKTDFVSLAVFATAVVLLIALITTLIRWTSAPAQISPELDHG